MDDKELEQKVDEAFTEVTRINTRAGRLVVFKKSVKLECYYRPLFFGTDICVSDLPEEFLCTLKEIINAAFNAGAAKQKGKIRQRYNELLQSIGV